MATFVGKINKFTGNYVLFGLLLANISLTYQAISDTYANGTDAIESGYLFAKFASKLSAVNYRVSRRSAYSTSGELIENCASAPAQPLRGDVPLKLGPWPSSGSSIRSAGPEIASRSRAKSTTVTVKPSSLFDNSQFSNLLESQCRSGLGFPDCYKDKTLGDAVLREAVNDYVGFVRQWLPSCNITRECAKVAETGKTDTWFSSRWTRIASNRSSNLPACYVLADLKDLSPERMDKWWFDFCCYTGAVCEPYSQSGWGKLLVADSVSAGVVSSHLNLLHDLTCQSDTTGVLDECVTDVIAAWNLLSGPTSSKIQSDAISTLFRCDPDLWTDPVRTFESMLNRLTPAEVETIHSVFDDIIQKEKAPVSQQIINTQPSSNGPIMVPHEFQLTPRAVSGIVVIIILILLSILVGGWGVYQRIQAWRHPRSHIQYAPIYMDDNDSPMASNEGLESVGRWSRVEDLGPDSDAEGGQENSGH